MTIPPLPFVRFSIFGVIGLLIFAGRAVAHDLGNPGDEHPHYDWSVRPPETVEPSEWFAAHGIMSPAASHPAQAVPFEAFGPLVGVHWDERFLYVESHGMPVHNMMVGITSWQQQVPVPQNYTGANAWRFPLHPVPAQEPQTIKGHFLRGAIAIAANGIPIFNPQNNRGEISAEIGELDQWGGHCGRADDYHYHAAPLHLQKVVGQGKPIAYALDGYPIYGLTEPDGSQPVGLDAFDGHTTPALGYHYHASTKYPYVNGGFHGEVVERDGQVDPQPHAFPVRQAMPPLRGATITGFEAVGPAAYKLTYELNGETRAVLYGKKPDGTYSFEFQGGVPKKSDAPSPVTKAGVFVLQSPEVSDGGMLPVDYTGDGTAATLPLTWSGAPAGTRSYALIMHHLDPQGKTKWYWTLYNIPAELKALPKNVKGVGTLGNNSINDQVGYAPPHSKGPGPKTYVLTLYALSAPLAINVPPSQVSMDFLIAAMKDKVLATADLHVVYTRPGSEAPPPRPGERPPPR